MRKRDPLRLARKIARGLRAKRGGEILLLDVRKISSVCDCMLIATARSGPHLDTLQEVARRHLEEDHRPIRQDGLRSPHWRVLESGGVSVHLFSTEARRFYELERLWRDGRRLRF